MFQYNNKISQQHVPTYAHFTSSKNEIVVAKLRSQHNYQEMHPAVAQVPHRSGLLKQSNKSHKTGGHRSKVIVHFHSIPVLFAFFNTQFLYTPPPLNKILFSPLSRYPLPSVFLSDSTRQRYIHRYSVS